MTTATTLDQLLQRIASLTDADAMTIAAVDNVGGLASLEACSSLEVAVIACCDAAIDHERMDALRAVSALTVGRFSQPMGADDWPVLRAVRSAAIAALVADLVAVEHIDTLCAPIRAVWPEFLK